MTVKLSRIWSMPNKSTFLIPPIHSLINRYFDSNSLWVDPFSGWNSPAQITNDMNEKMNSQYHLCALEFLKGLDSESVRGVFYDPPYSARQAREHYNSLSLEHLKPKNYTQYWSQCKNEIARIVKPGGIVICCGWNSIGLGKIRNFSMIETLLVPHGGTRYDTIVTVETKKYIWANNER